MFVLIVGWGVVRWIDGRRTGRRCSRCHRWIRWAAGGPRGCPGIITCAWTRMTIRRGVGRRVLPGCSAQPVHDAAVPDGPGARRTVAEGVVGVVGLTRFGH